jgi:hypothetical protein
MDSPWLVTAFKVIATLLMLLNLTFHGTVALFIGGPFGLALYLVGFVTLWTAGWLVLRRRREAAAKA